MMMYCVLTRADGAAIHTPLAVSPVRYSHAALGGPDAAEMTVAGANSALADVLTWLACKVTIYNESALPVWWGLVQTLTVTLDGVEYGLDASEIVNRMAVLYTDESGAAAQTLWVEDAHSIGLYGVRAVRESIRAESPTAALAQATRYVAERATPTRSVRAAGGNDGAKLLCMGLWKTLDWRYWSQDAGQELRDDDANTTELLAYSVTGTNIGIYRPHRRIGRTTADLHPLAAEDRVKISGSDSNDGVYEIAAGDDREATTTYASTNISFDPADDVLDGADGLEALRALDLIQISGSDDNDGYYFVKELLNEGGHATVSPGTIVAEVAGDTVTIVAGNQLELLAKPVATEMPGDSITLASQAVKVAQAVTIAADTAWELSEIWLQVCRVGDPSDSLQVDVCANAAGAPGAVLKSATLTGTSLPLLEAMDWQQWAFDSAQLLAPGALYWVVVSRTGASAAASYRVGLLEAAEGLSTDNLLLWDGAAWIGRSLASSLNAHLSLRIFGQRTTTSQIEDIVAETGDWLAGTAIRTASGIRSRLYRSAEDAQTALSEIKALLEIGTATNARLLARVSVDGMLFVDAAPSAAQPRYLWGAAGLQDRWGRPLPTGELPVGEWVAFELAGVVDTFGPAFLEAAEYDVASGAIRPSFRAERLLQSLARATKPAVIPDLAASLVPYLARDAGGVQRLEVANMLRSASARSGSGATWQSSSSLPAGSVTGDIIRWNAAAGAWETSSEPFALKQLVLTPAVAALLDREGGLWYKSTDKSVYVCTSDI